MATSPEVLLLSAVLNTGDYQTPHHRGITPALFHSHKREWKWLEAYCSKRRRTPSIITFKAKFPDVAIKNVDDVEHYCDELKQEHARFSLNLAMDHAIELMEQDDITGAMKHLHAASLTIQSQVAGESEDFDLLKDWDRIYKDVADRTARAAEKGMAGLPTGFPTLDLLTGGPQPGDLWIVGARLGQGKTWTCIRMASAMFYAGYRVQYDALEQTYAQVAFRFITFMSSKWGKEVFQSLDMMKGKTNLVGLKGFLQDLPKKVKEGSGLYISDTTRGRVTPLTIEAQIERNKPDVVLVDYITLMDHAGEDWRSVAKLSGEMKSLATRYEVPIICAAQINRAGVGKEPPRAENLSQADAIGQDADCVLTMSQQSKSVMKFRLAKYRHGQDGDLWYCEFTPGTGRFEEISGDKAQELMDHDREED